MRKRFVLKNLENNKYFTGNYNNWWSLNIADSFEYKEGDDMEHILSLLSEHYDNPIEGIDYLELVTIYCK